MQKQTLKNQSIPPLQSQLNRREGGKAEEAKGPEGTSAPDRALEPPSGRVARAAERRQAIVAAAMEEFVAAAFAATRPDNVAKRAGVAKGTIYLHFKDKEAMFEELIRTAIVPLVGRISRRRRRRLGARHHRRFAVTFIQEVVDDAARRHRPPDRRRGPEFPNRRFLLPRSGVARARRNAGPDRAGIARGEIRRSELARFPQIVVAPAIVAVIWKSLFEKAFAAGRGRDVSRPSRPDFWRTEDDMTSSAAAIERLAPQWATRGNASIWSATMSWRSSTIRD